MVIEDPFRNPVGLKTTSKVTEAFKLADPIDRLAATIIDLLIVVKPALMVLSAPFQQMIWESVLIDNDLNFAFSVFMSTLVVVLGIIFYQTIMVWLFGATLGKLFLGLRVVTVFDRRRPSFSGSLLRSCFWVLGVFTFGFSFLSILSNNRRRSLHDRVTETIVVTEVKTGAKAPSPIESSITKGIFAGFLAFVTLILSLSLVQTYQELNANRELVDFLENQGGLCAAVGEAQRDWGGDENSETPRLSIAMALYAAGTLDSSCLDSEVKFLFRQDRNDPLSYLAKSFIHSDRLKLSNSYLQRVCQVDENSPHCKMSQIVDLWDGEEWEKIDNVFASFDNEMPTYVRLWSIRHLVKRGDFDLVLDQIKRLPANIALKDFRIKFKTMAYWAREKSTKREVVADIAYDSLSDIQKVNLSAWVCYNELGLDCKNETSRSCKILSNYYENRLDKWNNELVALSYIHKNHCEGKESTVDHLSSASREVDKMAGAVNQLKQHRMVGRQKLWEIVNNDNFSEAMRSEAARYYIDSATSLADMSKISILWKVKESSFEWQKTGRTLFRRFAEMGYFTEAIQVGERLSEIFESDRDFQEKMVVSHYRTGNKTKAWEALKRMDVEVESDRSPASTNDFSSIRNALLREQGQ